MSQWVERVKNHAVWQTLDQLGPALDKALSRTNNTPEAIEGLERIKAVLTFSGKRLAAVDPFLLAQYSLDRINDAAVNTRAEADAFASDGDIGHIANAHTHADGMLTAVNGANAPSTPDDWTTFGDLAGNYRLRLEAHLRESDGLRTSVAARADELKTGLEALSAQVEQEKQKIANTVTEQQSQFANAQAERQDKANTAATEQQAQFTAAQEARAKEHADAQLDRTTRFSALMEEYGKRLAEQNAQFTADRDAAIKRYEAQLAGLRDTFGNSASGIVAEIEAHKTQVEKLVGVIGNLGVTSGYLKAANHARNALYAWQGLTVLALALLVWLGYSIATWEIKTDAEFYRALAGRAFVSLTLGVFAAYAAKQAANFWQVERRNRKLALELEALGPYISTLPEERRNAFREEIGHRSFGVADQDNGQTEKPPTNVADLLQSKELRDLIVGIAKGK